MKEEVLFQMLLPCSLDVLTTVITSIDKEINQDMELICGYSDDGKKFIIYRPGEKDDHVSPKNYGEFT
jgi:hypothetical protein